MGVRSRALGAGILVLSTAAGPARAQGAGAQPTPPTTSAPQPAATVDRPAPHAPAGATGPIATLPGFEMQADGTSKLFVALTQTVPVEERRVGHRITYVLKGARVLKRNNENALVTVHFNTPVLSARLLPTGADLAFIVNLRANVQATWKLTPAKDNTAILEIVFPKGDFLRGTAGADDESAALAGAPAGGDGTQGGDASGTSGTVVKTRPRVRRRPAATPSGGGNR